MNMASRATVARRSGRLGGLFGTGEAAPKHLHSERRFGGRFRARTGEPLIKSSPKPTNQAKPDQRFPKFSRLFALPLWVDLVRSAASLRTIRGQILDPRSAFRFVGRRGASI